MAVEVVAINPHSSETSTARLRILIVTARYVPLIGGTEIHTKELAERLAIAGHDVTVLTTDPRNKLPPSENLGNVKVVRVRAWPKRRDYYLAPGLYRVITGGTWDIVHIQGYHTFVAPIAMMAARRSGLPYVVAFHSGGHSSAFRRSIRGVQRQALRPLLAGAERLIGGSAFEAGFFQQKLKLPARQFAVVPVTGHLPASIAPFETRSTETLLVSVGRLERYKGHHRVIEALPLVAAHYSDVCYRIAGDGPYEHQLRLLAVRLGVHDRVEIDAISSKDRQGMARLLSRAALVISLSQYESAGMAVREALALRRPALIGRTSALTELADFPLVATIALTSSIEEIAAAIVAQLRRPAADLGVTLPSWDKIVSAYEEIYRGALRRTR